MDSAPNDQQIEYWNNGVGRTWVKFQAGLDHQLAPIGRRALDALEPAPGERILDVGCGAGATTLEIAAAVGRSGAVTGVDISEPLLEAARARPLPERAVRPDFLAADAQVHPFESGGFDAVFSRFGVMFFDDPGAAFANLRRATRLGGRLAFACWRSPAENPWMSLPLRACEGLVEAPPPTPPDAPGPFAFADAGRLRAIVTGARWRDFAAEAFDTTIGGGGLDDSARLMTRVGPLGAALREAGAERDLIAAAEARVRDALEPWLVDGEVRVPSAVWIVTARA